jgi:AcrR family transcriptional regulator
MTPTATATASQPELTGSARERLLAAANELFYAEGVQSVGIDRIIERAGVAKASLYNTFGSKDALVRAYLDARHASTAARIEEGIARYDTPREQLLGIFEVQAEVFTRPTFRGCAFVAASGESKPGGVVEEATDEFRTEIRARLRGLAAAAGAADPGLLAAQLQALYDGATITARLDRTADAGVASRAAAAILIDAAIG